MYRAALLSFVLFASCQSLAAAEVFAGPVEARVISVLDGDTVRVEAFIWPGQTLRIAVRLRGVNAPEIKSRCPAERAAGFKAREALAARLGAGQVQIRNIAGEKYYGRVLADLSASDGEDVGPWLLAEGLAVPYAGGKRLPAC